MECRPSERRRYKRMAMACPIALHDGKGHKVTQAKADNISNGGLFLTVPLEVLEKIGGEINLAFSVPRRTTNSYMLEEFACRAKVVRQEADTKKTVHIAMAFTQPMPILFDA